MPALATLRSSPPAGLRILARMSLDTTPDEAAPTRRPIIVHRRPVAASTRAERPQEAPRYNAVRILRLVACLEALRARILAEPDMEERWRLRGRFARVLEVYLRCF